MRYQNCLRGRIPALAFFLLATTISGWAQDSAPPPAPESMATAIQELQTQVRELRSVVTEMRSEAAQYRAETAALRQELEATRSQLAPGNSPAPNWPADSSTTTAKSASQVPDAPPNVTEGRIASLEESSQLLTDKINEQYQTKVESASKYRVRLSGIVLLNLFSNRGTTDNQDFPSYATGPESYYSNGNLGASLRQSEIGLEVFGPRLAGARTEGNVQADFSGGFPKYAGRRGFGIVPPAHCQRTHGLGTYFHRRWPGRPVSFSAISHILCIACSSRSELRRQSLGLDSPVRIEHRFELAEKHTLLVQGGILDNLTGQPPYGSYGRTPQAGEASGEPALGGRVAWTTTLLGRSLTVGGAGYFGRQNWGFDRYVDGWAGMTDWDIPLAPRVSLSGEFYRGLAVGGLGGGFGESVLMSGSLTDPTTQVRGLDSMGGWSQLKVRTTAKLEFNGAFGMDNPYAFDLRIFPASQSYVHPTLARNQAILGNFIFLTSL